MDPITLNAKQSEALTKIKQFMGQEKDSHFYLFGYAGTGKSFIARHIVNELINEKMIDQVYVCAPTHTALNVIECYFEAGIPKTDEINPAQKSKINFMTIHKLLEFRPIISNENGEQVFKSTVASRFLKPGSRKLIIIDECSMIPKDIVNSLSQYQAKIIFLGDPAQLPPVREKSSVIFTNIPTDYCYHIILDEIMRTKSDDIKKISNIVRKWGEFKNPENELIKIHNHGSKKFHLYYKGTKHNDSRWFRSYIRKLNAGQSPIILTWKNETADYYNKLIRQHIHKITVYTNDFIINDHAMFTKYYKAILSSGELKPNIYFYTSNIIKIISITTKKRTIIHWSKLKLKDTKTNADIAFNKLLVKLDKFSREFNINIYEVTRNDGIDHNLYYVKTIGYQDAENYRKMITNVREHLEHFYFTHKSDKLSNKLWDEFHASLREPYAELSFGYSITTHKSQGSTFSAVMVDLVDICDNPNEDEAMKALYTASTRGSDDLSLMVD